MPKNRLHALHDAGVSIWLDFIDRVMLRNGDLQRRIRDDALVGMTSNPTIFEKALAEGAEYDDQIKSAPSNLTAMLFGFEVKPQFAVANEAELAQPPVVDFGARPATQ